MFNHAPENYKCPICLGVQGVESEYTLLHKEDLIFKNDLVSAFINSFWIGKNEGHVIVVPNDHYEHLYDLPAEAGAAIFDVSKRIALGLKETYGCDGVTLRQNNEPASEQHALHYHQHIFPRYTGDKFNEELVKKRRLSDPEERGKYSERLRAYLSSL